MANLWLVIDAPNLCHRAFFTTGGLDNGTTFGFLREVLSLRKRFNTDRLAFCFDHGESLRKRAYPAYKANRDRKEYTPEEKQAREGMREEITRLRREVLWDLGYKNVFWQRGYEADDLIATTVLHSLPPKDSAVIVSGDKDLYQLLRTDRVKIWKPTHKTFYTQRDLANEFHGISPEQWHCVKSVAGCASDNVAGVKGVGEDTAAKFLMKKLSPARDEKILAQSGLWAANQKLVRLPFEGAKAFELVPDGASPEKWRSVLKMMNMGSLLEAV